MSENEQLIDLIAGQTRNLLQNHWPDIQDYRDGEADIKISFAHTLSYEGTERTVKTVIGFSHRIKAEISETLDVSQAALELGIPPLPKKGRGK